MKDEIRFRPYVLESELTNYMPVPRELTEMALPSTAVLIYGALLDRGTLSRKNHYADEEGRVYVIYPVERLAETFHISDTAVKRHLKELESKGLIWRCREKRYGPSHIYLSLPECSFRETQEGTSDSQSGAKVTRQRGRKVPSNNSNQQPKENNYYQHREDESL